MNIEKNNRGCAEQFINGINGDDIMTEMKQELTTVKKTSEIMTEQVLA